MISASDIMTTDVVTFTPETEIVVAARTLLESHINGAPVVDAEQRLVGILCQSDLIAQQKRFPVPSVFTFLDSVIPLTSSQQVEKEMKKIAALNVGDAMSADPITVSPENSVETVAALMVDNCFHSIPVVEDGKLVGIVGKEDVLRTLLPETD